jgi:hypothetical protein
LHVGRKKEVLCAFFVGGEKVRIYFFLSRPNTTISTQTANRPEIVAPAQCRLCNTTKVAIRIPMGMGHLCLDCQEILQLCPESNAILCQANRVVGWPVRDAKWRGSHIKKGKWKYVVVPHHLPSIQAMQEMFAAHDKNECQSCAVEMTM